MAYTTIDKPSDYFETKLYTGTQQARNITGLDFAPNWVWIKKRTGASGTSNHYLFDSIRGASKTLFSNATNAEDTNTNSLTAFNSDGFSLGNDTDVNVNNGTFASWNWKAGTALNNSAGSNNGSIASTGSFSTAAGFSIVKWAGSNAAGTIYTGLSGKIDFVILKNLSTTRNWIVKPKSFAANDVLYFQATNATVNAPGDGWINALTATNGTIGLVAGGSNTNPLKNVNENNANYIAYCFQEKTGFSKFGSYKGNGNADGTFVYTGFKPAFILQKNTARAGSGWGMFDTTRTPTNVSKGMLIASSNAVEDTSDASRVDFLSNGFKWRTTDNWFNDSGALTIFMAFAENPFVTSTGVPATAR